MSAERLRVRGTRSPCRHFWLQESNLPALLPGECALFTQPVFTGSSIHSSLQVFVKGLLGAGTIPDAGIKHRTNRHDEPAVK